jgi:phage-related protein
VIGPLGQKFGELAQTLVACGAQMYERFIKPLYEWFMDYLWPAIELFAGFIGTVLKGAFDLVISIFGDVLTSVADIVGGILEALGGIIKFLTGIFTGDWKLAWEGIQQIFTGVWDALGGIIKGVINIIIDVINALLSATHAALNFVIGGLNSLSIQVPDWVPGIGGQNWGFNIPPVEAIQIPRLATGAVIPPNAAFAAILGDQRSGTNIEAPESLIRQIIQEEMGKVQAEVTINFAGSLAALVRELKPYIDDENTRVGVSLIEGIA